MSMKGSLKKTASSVLAIMMIFVIFTGTALASSNLKDGEYKIKVSAIHAQTGEPSRMNNQITNPVKLEVQNGKIYVILDLADTSYDLAVDNGNGGFTKAQVISENVSSKTFTYKFPVQSIDEPVLMETVVAAMGAKVNFKLAFDKASLVSITQESTANTNENKSSTTTQSKSITAVSENVANPKTGDHTFDNLANVLFVAMGMSVVTYGVYKLKEKYIVKN